MADTATRKLVFNEINITPLTDIFLVLLIIMMVVAPMMQSLNRDITPPTVENGAAVEPSRLTVEVTQDGKYLFEGETVEIDSLTDQLIAVAEEMETPPEERNLIVRADKNTRSAAVIRVFEAARDASFYKVTVAGQQKSDQIKDELDTGLSLEEAIN